MGNRYKFKGLQRYTSPTRLEHLFNIWTPAALFAQGQQGVWLEASPTYKGQQVLWQQSDGTVIADANGDPVGRADDLSPNGNNATQPTSADRPLYGTDGSLHWLGFDSVDDSLNLQSVIDDVQPLASVSVLIAVKRKSSADFIIFGGPKTSAFLFIGDTNTNPAYGDGVGSPTVYVDNIQIFTRQDMLDATSDLGWHIIEARSVSFDPEWTEMHLHKYSAGGFNPAVDVGGIIFANSPTDDARDKARGYLADLVGVTL